jgi:hypothetical protein
MQAPRRSALVRALWLGLLGLGLGVAGLLGACASDDAGGNATGDGGGVTESGKDTSVMTDPDGGPEVDGAPLPGTDAGDSGTVIVDGPGKAGAPCAFNRECNAALRCECSENAGCECKPGARGTGKNGIDPCLDGNACASSLCVEGPPDAGSFCSDECDASTDCTGKLPVCSNIAFVGKICIRQPPM